MRKIALLCLTVMLLIGLTSNAFASSWLLSYKGNKLPDNLVAKIHQAQGELISSLDEVGIAVAEFTNRVAAEAMESDGFEVIPNVMLNWIGEDNFYSSLDTENIGLNENYYGYQWYLPVIQADLAWNEGMIGEGVRVAVIDSGIWYYHPDLYNNIDFAASASFVPGVPYSLDDNGHGTHVAGIIAAADNDWGSIGIAPSTTLIGIKVLKSDGSGYTSSIIEGITHAVKQQADIINLSLGSYLKKNGEEPYYTAKEAAKIKIMFNQVINWATAQGTLVVSSAGNNSRDLDHDGNWIKLPAGVNNAIAVSATGPIGLQDFDHFASYSNYGASIIWVSAPGGDAMNYPAPNWWEDMVFSTYIGGWAWMAGTSMAAPMVSGVAALVLSKYGKMNPNTLKNHLAQTAEDLGKPGKDPFYGRGHINAYAAVTK